MPSGQPTLTPKRKGQGRPPKGWQDRFFEALRNTGNVRAACQAAGVSRWTVYDRKAHDEEFADRWAQAEEEAIEVLEAEARRRATTGQSDTLLIFLLKSHRPAKYRESYRVEHAGKVEHQVEAAVKVDLSVLTSAELAQLMELQDKLEGRGQ